jgi:glycosyltransferase involved in cell wall biosynthesis
MNWDDNNLAGKTVLISTVYTQAHGGVFAMLRFLVRFLQEMDCRVQIAYYIPYSIKPELSVPFQKLFQKKPGVYQFTGELGVEEYAIGSLLPEFEFANYYPNSHWRKLIKAADLAIVISGHILSAMPFYWQKKKYIAWIATLYDEDRRERIKTFPWYRKCLDQFFISKIGRQLEKNILRKNPAFTISSFSHRQLNQHGSFSREMIPVPIDTHIFFPKNENVQPGLICFTGRFLDPRKNIHFLFDAFAIVLEKIKYAKLCLIGDEITPAITEKLSQLGIASHVQILNFIPFEKLVAMLQRTDVFVIPSSQEGLCISGLEAMACGCPVVSTLCGGPTDYVEDGENGYLVDFNSATFADKIVSICENRELREKMSAHSLQKIQENYSDVSVKKKWTNVINQELIS